MNFLKKHKENILVAVVGLIIFATLNAIMLQYHYNLWTNPKVGFWSAFWNRFEISGFDSYTYIIVSQWRPLYTLSRHPLLALMFWPLSELNGWLTAYYHTNFAIFLVAAVWILASMCSWMILYRIFRRLIVLTAWKSLLLTLYFFSFSHVMLTTFVPDHMTLTLPLLLLSLYLAGSAVKKGKLIPLWQTLLLAFVATGVTTTNVVKVVIADIASSWRKATKKVLSLRLLAYAIPLAFIGIMYFYQLDTTQRREKERAETIIRKRSEKDSLFAKKIAESQEATKQLRANQIVNLSIVTNTEYHIDRLPSLVENVFGEGFMLHEDHVLKDANRERPVLVRYRHWSFYAIEGLIVGVFVLGAWYGRKERLMVAALLMFLFDMALHVGLNFASADVYIMTAHWAFVVPIATAFLMKRTENNERADMLLSCTILFLTVFLFVHNLRLTIPYILSAS